ncbi:MULTISPECIES: hypothetical protein [unclassified Microcoleus]|uniref:nSTAND1 domain-containing NTPase n=1 Tax=unclassified Microcoleus TaxID=2642155 RepID=UPI0025F53387|nr:MULTISPECIES: hypothetical protein [unclassified Microcoleus]
MTEGNIQQTITGTEYAAVSATGDAYVYVIHNYREDDRSASIKPADISVEELERPSPYRGLSYFETKHAELFFGRNSQIDELKNATHNRNFIPILGASGSGKSSLVLAGLIPKLAEQGNWLFTYFRLGSNPDPFYVLAEALLPLYRSDEDNRTTALSLAQKLKDNKLEIAKIFTSIQSLHPNHKLLLIADQFEQLYTAYNDETQHLFLDLLLSIIQPSDRESLSAVMVTTMRIDFLDKALAYPAFAEAFKQGDIKLGAMTRDKLEQVIEQPALKYEVAFQDGLIERILSDVYNKEDCLPLLEFALEELWNKRIKRLKKASLQNKQIDRQITHEDYTEIGEVKGALATYADDVYNNLTPAQKEQLPKIFIQLINFSQFTKDRTDRRYVRRVAKKTELGEKGWRLVQILAEKRLVVTNRNADDEDTVEIIHETLIKEWLLIETWMKDNRDFGTWLERLRAAMSQWEKSDRDSGALLRGKPLTDAEDWLQKYGEDLTNEREYIQLSLQLRDWEKAEKERQEREKLETQAALEAKKKETLILAAAKQQAEAQLTEAQQEKKYIITQAEQEKTQIVTQAEQEKTQLIAQAEQEKTQIVTQAEQEKTQIVTQAEQEKTQIVTQAQKEKKQIIRSGLSGLAVIVVVALTVVGAAWKGLTEAQKGTQLEQAGVNSLFQFKSGELSSLVSAMQSTQDLQKLIGNRNNPKDYPAVSPILALQKILDDIHEQNYFEAGQGDVKGAVFLPNGKSFITAGEGKENKELTLQTWNLAGKKEASLQGHEGGLLSGVNAVSVGGNAQNPVIASAGEDGTVRLWNKSGQQIKQLVAEGKPNYDSFTAIAVTPNGQKIIAGKGNGTVYLWDKSGKQVKTWVAHGKKVTAISFSKNGQTLVTAGNDGLARIWMVTGNKLGELKHPQIKKMLGVSLSPDGKFVATASDDNRARIWTVAGQEVRRLEGHQGWVTVVNFSPNGESIATGSDDGSVKLWNAKTGENLQDFRGHRGAILSASFSLDGKQFVSTGKDGFVRLWNLADRPLQGLELTGFKDDVNAIAFSPDKDGKYIAGAGNEGIMRLWDATSGKELKVWKEAIQRTFNSPNNVQDIAFSPDGKFIVAGGLRIGIARVWNLAGSLTEPQVRLKGKEEKQEAHQNSIRSVAVSPDSQLIATGSHDQTMRIWKPNSPNGELVAVIPAQEGVVSRVLFTADGRRIVTADWEGNVAIWDLAGQLIRKWEKVHPTQIRGLGVTKDGKWIVTADLNGNVKILDDSGSTKREFFSYQSGVNELTVSPDGQLIATGGMDGTVKLWDFQGRQVAEFRNPKGWIWGIAFSPDGKRIALAGEKGFVSVKSIEPLSDLMKEGCSWLHNYLTLHPSENNGSCQ